MIEQPKTYWSHMIPDFIDRSVVRKHMTAGAVSNLFRVGEYNVKTYVEQRKRAGRPIKSLKQAANKTHGYTILYRPLDILAAARADGFRINKPIEAEIQEKLTGLALEKHKLINEIDNLISERDKLKREVNFMLGDFSDISPLIKQEKFVLAPKSLIVEKATNYNNACGVYFLVKNGEIVYVGQSINIANRITAHRDKDFDDVSFILCEPNNLNILETLYILAYQPKYNGFVSHGFESNKRPSTPISLQQLINLCNKEGL